MGQRIGVAGKRNDLQEFGMLRRRHALGAGLLEANQPPGFYIPMQRASDDLLPDKNPLDGPETDQLPLEMHLPEATDVSEDMDPNNQMG